MKRRMVTLVLAAAMILSLLAGCAKKEGSGQIDWTLGLDRLFGGEEKPDPEAVMEKLGEKPAESGLTLLLSEDTFVCGTEEMYVTITVLCDESVTEDVAVFNNYGEEVEYFENDGSGRFVSDVALDVSDEGMYSLVARSGSAESLTVNYYVTPALDDTVVENLTQVANDLGSFIMDSGFEDPYSDEALDAVAEHLEEDERVEAAAVNNGSVIYLTTDGLTGSYGLDRTDPDRMDTLGFTKPQSAFNDWQDGMDLDTTVLRGTDGVTNSKIFHICPSTNDATIDSYGPYYEKQEKEMARAMDAQFTVFKGADARDLIYSGDYADCGMLFFITHGSTLIRSDGSTMLFMRLAYEKDVTDTIKFYNRDDGDGPLPDCWTPAVYDEKTGDILAPDNTKIVYDLTVKGEGKDRSVEFRVLGSSNYFMSTLRDKTFDNTIIFFIVCYAYSDARFRDFLINHGASAVIGCSQSLNSGVAAMTIDRLSRVMSTEREDGGLGTLGEAATADTADESIEIGEDALREVFNTVEDASPKELEEMTNDALESYHEQISTAPMNFYVRVDSIERCYDYDATLSGRVVTSDGDGVPDVEVTLYRWLDHDFAEEETLTTDENGRYEASVPIGIYGILARGKQGKDRFELGTTVDLISTGSKAEDIVVGYGEIDGTVVDAETGEAIPGATVTLPLSDGDTVTVEADLNGAFYFEKVAPDDYTLTVSAEGYMDFTTASIKVEAGKRLSLDPIMLPQELVRLAYLYVGEYNQDEETHFTYRIPKVNFDTESARAANEAIWNKFYDEKYMLTNHEGTLKYVWRNSSYMDQIDYSYGVKDDLLSLYVFGVHPSESQTRSNLYYNFSISSGEVLSDDEFLAAMGYTWDTFYDFVRKDVDNYWERELTKYKYNEDWMEKHGEALYRCIESGKAEENILKAKPYLNDEGELDFYGVVYPWIAG